MTEDEQFRINKDLIRGHLLKYTREALRMLPNLDRPRILDIGCGTGVSTIEVARLSRGEVTAIDIDQTVLDRFIKRIDEAGLADRIKVMNCSLLDMTFSDESFDIIISEGSIFVIGFKRGLQEWKWLLKPNGCMIIHDEQGDVEQKLEQIAECGYKLLGYFLLDIETWRNEYFAPLEKLVSETEKKCNNDPGMVSELQIARQEIDVFRNSPENNSSVFFVIQRN
jgi:ubiquinone/menaquinone biosynthesis C-methylase UbiE